MPKLRAREQTVLEVILVILTIGLTCLVSRTVGYKLVTLNLFYLPVVLSGFFLGRYRAGVLAVLSVISASLVCAMQLNDFSTFTSPLVVGLAVTIWGAVLCLTAMLVGTLSDERNALADELHDAYVGVVDVLAQYLQGGNSQLNVRAVRVAKLSQLVAWEMKLSPKRIDDIRVAALMHGIGAIEVTTKVINRAVVSLENKSAKGNEHQFQGTDLLHSLSTVLHGAMPILLNQDNSLRTALPETVTDDVPLGARILRAVRAYDSLTASGSGDDLSSREAIHTLRADRTAEHDPDVLDVLENVTADCRGLAAV